MQTEPGHAPSRVYHDTDGDLHLNGAKLRLDETGAYLDGSTKDVVGGLRNLRATRLIEGQGDPTFDNTAGALTLTAAMVLGGTLLRDPNGAGRTDVLPTAALLVAAVPSAQVGDVVALYVANCADAAETITMSAGAGGTWKATQIAASRIVGQNASRYVFVRLTNVGAGTEAYDAWM